MKTSNVLVSANSDGSINHWHVTSGRCLHTIDPIGDNHIYTIDYNDLGTQFATAGKDTNIRVYDENTKSVVQTLGRSADIPGHSNRIFSVKFDPQDPNLLYSGGWDNSIVGYDVRQEKPICNFLGPHVCGESLDVRDGALLAGSYDVQDNLVIWDLKTYKKREVVDWFGSEIERTEETQKPAQIYGCCFSKPGGNYLLAGGTVDNEVRLFQKQAETGTHKCVAAITDMSKACMSVDYGNQSDIFAFGCADGFLRIMSVDNA